MSSNFIHSKHHAEFLTVTCSDWKPVLENDSYKDIVVQSLKYLSELGKVSIYAFVIMSNHLHVIWQVLGNHERSSVQRDFLKFTSHQLLRRLKSDQSSLVDALMVKSKDRMYHVWQRNSLRIPLWSDQVVWQKLEYIHNNPVKAGICELASVYKYSSAGFYFNMGYQ